ncbi:cation:proton antiporter [Bacteroides faecichinchillae]|uniref:Transporter, CPA2 family n=1 Tax=Bacteroides faecichinchillae TaxID=871325 RepID=A0A1M4U882_9BACE|nr:cation:proton antiporter [Bacteroides faecichinchillae]THG69757.1 cation:proton antiporter [Bacteroides faecichinchillae]SHE53081.1 transporter, CPA2 family [Bacteroides faecichinchillae]
MNLFDFDLTIPITDPTWVFFLVLIIILFAPMILGRLHIPHIIGMILAGVLIGEHGFHILDRDSSFELFGKVGLYYIMFLAGLEMDMEDFKKNRTKGVVFGLFTFVIPMLLGVWSSMSFLGYGFTTAVLLASMYASHTLIAYPIISRYGLSRLRCVNITIGGTAVTVTLALIILAVIGGMYKGTIDGMFWVLLVVKVAFLGFLIIFFFPRIGRWFFRKYDDSVMQFVFVLAMVFLGGGLMEFVGMEGILGAFLAGLVLNRLIPHVSPLMNRLEFVGNALFIPYFLIGVGMIIDIRSLFMGGEALKVALVMTIVATISKWLAAWLTQKIYHMQPNERSMMFGLSNAQAAATLAAVLIGHEIIMENGERLLNDDVLNGTVVMILFTCIISSLVTERSARRFAINESVQEEEGEKKLQEQILIPVANPETIEDLINLALVIKDAKQKNGLIALNVINDNNSSENKELQGKRNLEKAAMIAAAADVPVTMVSRYDLNIASGIIHTIKEYEATDVVIGLHRKANIVDSFFGNLAENLLKGTHREVMIAKFLMPVNTLRRINIAVPPKAEYETGFQKWVEHFCRMGSMLGCRVHFFANEHTLMRLQQLVKKRHNGTPTEFSILEEWDDLLLLTGQVNYDHLLVVISARRGSISYDPSFERLPGQLGKYFANNSLIILYPDQFGEPQEIVSFSDPRGYNESQHYDKVGKWFYKWLKKS